MKSGIRSAQSTPTAPTMLRYVRLCADATPSISVTIRGKAAKAAPTIGRWVHKQQSEGLVDRFFPVQRSCRHFRVHLAAPAEYGGPRSKVRHWLYATGNCSAQCRSISAAIAARKPGPIVAIACAPTIDCRMREGEVPCRALKSKSYRTKPRRAPSTRSGLWLFEVT
jgi:hypothetical protein